MNVFDGADVLATFTKTDDLERREGNPIEQDH